jgi:DNA invertase Pin-like site-specific DNA recombinase
VIAAYMRVSSDAQSLAMQRDAIDRCAVQRGEKIAHWYAEKESATRSMQRPALAKMRQDSREGKIAKLYVYRLDRFTRTGIRDTLLVLEELKEHGTKVVTVADGFDVSGSGPGTEMVVAAMAWAAQMEGNAITERLRAARARVEATGGTWGRPRRMSEDQVARAFAYKKRGKNTRQIAAALKIPHATVARALRRLSQKPPPKEKPRRAGK